MNLVDECQIEDAAIVISSDSLQLEAAAVGGIEALPKILAAVRKTTGMGFAVVARVTEHRWIACAACDDSGFGLRAGGELPVATTICDEIRVSRQPVVISDFATDETHRSHPAQALYGFQSYISIPIILPDGSFFGTLCAMDRWPARWNAPDITAMFELFAELIALHVSRLGLLSSSDSSLRAERKKAELREQFIAVVGHDLRNPLAAIDANLATLRLHANNCKASRIIDRIVQSISRMSGLIEDMLDFARGSLGDGLILYRDPGVALEPVLMQVTQELCAVWPDRTVETQFSILGPVRCDHRRMGQLLSNILGNALAYGAANRPVRVMAMSDAAMFELSVWNAGDPIPPATLKTLFHPFVRGTASSTHRGLGLGLFIASEIARAHGGTLGASSSAEGTQFTFRMPLT
jgi:signal transduction histidine kinase